MSIIFKSLTVKSKAKIDVFFATFILSAFVFAICFVFALAKNEGTLGAGVIENFIADNISYFFPFLLLEESLKTHSLAALMTLTGLNLFLYSLIAALLLTNPLVTIKSYKPFNATYYLTMTILLTILAKVIYLIITSK